MTSALQVLHPGAYLKNSFQHYSLYRPPSPSPWITHSPLSPFFPLFLFSSLLFLLLSILLYICHLSIISVCLVWIYFIITDTAFSSAFSLTFSLSLSLCLWPSGQTWALHNSELHFINQPLPQILSALKESSFIHPLLREGACKCLLRQPAWQRSKLLNTDNIFWKHIDEFDCSFCVSVSPCHVLMCSHEASALIKMAVSCPNIEKRGISYMDFYLL